MSLTPSFNVKLTGTICPIILDTLQPITTVFSVAVYKVTGVIPTDVAETFANADIFFFYLFISIIYKNSPFKEKS
jgi:hypothetical protein